MPIEFISVLKGRPLHIKGLLRSSLLYPFRVEARDGSQNPELMPRAACEIPILNIVCVAFAAMDVRVLSV
jgi:hypothetical protein